MRLLTALLFSLLSLSAFAQPVRLDGNTLDGQRFSLDALRGKVVMLFFWNTDCAPCIQKMPELRANAAGWRGKPFELVLVSTDHDCAAALAWGLDHAEALGGNPRRVFVMGHSAGAYNAAMLALDPRWLQQAPARRHTPRELAGFVGLAGPYDFLPMTNPDARPVFFHPDYPPGTQPLEHAGKGAPRSFLGAARNDELVNPQRNSQGLASRLQAAHVPVTLKFYDRVGHMTLVAAFGAPLRWLAPVLDDVAGFVNEAPPR